MNNKSLQISLVFLIIFTVISSGCINENQKNNTKYSHIGIEAYIYYSCGNNTNLDIIFTAIENDSRFFNIGYTGTRDSIGFDFYHQDLEFNSTDDSVTFCILLTPSSQSPENMSFELFYSRLVPRDAKKPKWFEDPEKYLYHDTQIIIMLMREILDVEPDSVIFDQYMSL